MTTQTFAIEGMTCGSCVKSVEQALNQIDGVDNVQVSLGQKQALVDFDERKTTAQAIATAIEDTGFDVGS